MPPKTSHPHRLHPHLITHLHRLVRNLTWLRRSHLLQRRLRSPSQIPAGHHHHHLHLRNRTCPWLIFPHPRRSSLQAWSLALWSPAAPWLPPLPLPALPKPHPSKLKPLHQHHLHLQLQLVLFQNLWPSSLRRTLWARTVGLPGRMLAHLWSHPHSCRWYGFALWVLPQGHQVHLQGHQLHRSHFEEPCQGGPAQCLPPPLGSMQPSDSRPPAWLPLRALEVPCPLDHQRQSHGLHNLLPPRPASSSPRAPKNCSLSGRCLLRPRLTSSGIWWLNSGAFQSSGHHRLRRSLPRLPHLWPASPLWESLLPPPVFLGLSLLVLQPPTGSLTLRTGLRGSWLRMEVCSWLVQRRWAPLVQIHRRDWSDLQLALLTHPRNTISQGPEQLQGRKDTAHSLRKDACSLNLHSLPCLCKPGVAHPPSHPSLMPFPERIHLQQSVSLGLSLILKKVAGGSGWLCPTPTQGHRGGSRTRLFCFMLRIT